MGRKTAYCRTEYSEVGLILPPQECNLSESEPQTLTLCKSTTGNSCVGIFWGDICLCEFEMPHWQHHSVDDNI